MKEFESDSEESSESENRQREVRSELFGREFARLTDELRYSFLQASESVAQDGKLSRQEVGQLREKLDDARRVVRLVELASEEEW